MVLVFACLVECLCLFHWTILCYYFYLFILSLLYTLWRQPSCSICSQSHRYMSKCDDEVDQRIFFSVCSFVRSFRHLLFRIFFIIISSWLFSMPLRKVEHELMHWHHQKFHGWNILKWKYLYQSERNTDNARIHLGWHIVRIRAGEREYITSNIIMCAYEYKHDTHGVCLNSALIESELIHSLVMWSLFLSYSCDMAKVPRRTQPWLHSFFELHALHTQNADKRKPIESFVEVSMRPAHVHRADTQTLTDTAFEVSQYRHDCVVCTQQWLHKRFEAFVLAAAAGITILWTRSRLFQQSTITTHSEYENKT